METAARLMNLNAQNPHPLKVRVHQKNTGASPIA